MDRTTLSRSLDILYKYKLIENLKSNDARKRMVKLTPKGLKFEQAIPLWKEAEDEVLMNLKNMVFLLFNNSKTTESILISSPGFGGSIRLTFSRFKWFF